jgi:Fusaric acid resistance protein-like
MTNASSALRRAASRAAERVRPDAWRLLQQAVAATVAWVLASYVVDHREPFFAPIAAVVALNAPLGERGGNALRLLEGVVIGIVCGELALAALDETTIALFLATLACIATVRALGGTPLAVAQGAAAAILTVAFGDSEVGPDRLIDTLIGGGVALVFSQVLFTPEPVRLLRRAEAGALADIAGALDLTARAIDEDDRDLADRAIGRLRDLRDQLAELGRTRDASRRVARRSAAWRSQQDPVVQENENAGQLDLLGGSALMVVRTATSTEGGEREIVAPAIRELAAEVRDLARDPGDRGVRQRAADCVLKTAHRLRSDDRVHDAAPGSALSATVVAVRGLALDTMVFAGVDADEAMDAVRRDDADLDVPTPPHAPRIPFKRQLQLRKRTGK